MFITSTKQKITTTKKKKKNDVIILLFLEKCSFNIVLISLNMVKSKP